MEIWAAIDLSGKEAFFSIGEFPERRILSSSSFAMKGRDSSSLLPKIEDLLQKESISIEDVSRWTAGTGPGNYTGLRIVSALISGMAFGRKDVSCRGIPSALAVLQQIAPGDGEDALVIYPYEKNSVFSFCGMFKNGRFSVNSDFTGVFPDGDFMRKFQGMKKAFMEKDADRISGDILRSSVGISVFPVQNLVFADPERWDGNSVKDLIYIRPAVNVAPMQIRTEL
ncbi:MAG TPA: hypothetical protein DCZ94_02300 [Lentisphaeria bacterium]|nr:MAG: hypothetical protein A2X48_16250 [Lentisphaerae bacterium GWF2_49_21]HBC85765.1 hypothetical protein [Lentisphaeria bacterium]